MTELENGYDRRIPRIGEDWVYRLRDGAPSQRVRILQIHPKNRSSRFDVEFLDGDAAGTHENVPAIRLRAPWSQVDAYDKMMANWEMLANTVLDHVEEGAAEMVFNLLIPTKTAELSWSPVNCATEIHRSDDLSQLLGISISDLASNVPSFEIDDALILSPAATLVIAEHACRSNPVPVLDAVTDEEREARHRCKHGGKAPNLGGPGEIGTSPEQEYSFYRKYDRPRHELLRQWCGYRAVSFHERLAAAEAENQRLDELLGRMTETFKERGETGPAEIFEREHEEERITPYKIRPVPERPLDPSEIPVRIVQTRGWWRH
jgi:hypothetical protein